jgi:predicted DNA-binding protein
MSKALSLKLTNEIFDEVETITKEIHKPRNTYINEALAFYNKLLRRKNLKKLLIKESKLISRNSMSILDEFESIEDDILE